MKRAWQWFNLIFTLGVISCVPAGPSAVSPAASSVPSPSPSPSASASPELNLSGRFLFYEDFEKDLSRWRIDGSGDGIAWLRLNAFTCGGAYSMLFGKGEMELFSNAVAESVLTLLPPIDLRTARHPVLAYDVRGMTIPEEAVVIQAEASRDGQSWGPIGAPAIGKYRYASTIVADVSPYLGATMRLRFRATLKAGETPIKGMLFDDVKVIELESAPPSP